MAGMRVRGSGSAMSGRYLLGRIVAGVLLAGAALIVVEIVSVKFGPHLARRSMASRLWRPVTPDRYEALVGAIASVGGVLLALYFTTVGVVASNSYSSVPGQLRKLFLAERTGSWYIRLLAWTVSLSILVLACRIVGYQPHAATIAFLTAAAVAAVFMLAVLGSRLFVFFDLAALAAPLPRRWKRIVGSAWRYGRRRHRDLVPRGFRARRWERFLANEQADGQVSKDLRLCTAAQAILETYREIVTVLVTADGGELCPLTGLGINLANCWLEYAAVKSAIPTRSRFYRRRYEHPNVLTADESSRQLAVSTRTFVQPKQGPDHLWVERDLADRLDELLRRLLADADWSEALRLLDTVGDLAAWLTVRAQVAEALLLWQRVADRFWRALADGPTASTRVRTPEERLTYQLATAEMVPRVLTRMWLALVQFAEALQPGRLQGAVLEALYLPEIAAETGAHARETLGSAAVLGRLRGHASDLAVRLHESRAGNWARLYALGAPHLLLERLEVVASRLDVERFAERRPVTPAWWVADQAG